MLAAFGPVALGLWQVVVMFAVSDSDFWDTHHYIYMHGSIATKMQSSINSLLHFSPTQRLTGAVELQHVPDADAGM